MLANPTPAVVLPRQGFALVDWATGTTLADRLNAVNGWADRNGDRIARVNQRVASAVQSAAQTVTQSETYRNAMNSPFMT